MTDLLGALVIPTVSVAPELAGDPMVSRLLKFIVAALVNDKQLEAAWAQVSRVNSPIRTAFTHDPEDWHLPQPAVTQLPALYLYRHEIEGERNFAADFSFRTSKLHLRYVYEMAEPDQQADRVGIPNAIVSIVTAALYFGRTPSFRIANDPDAQASYLGSWMPALCGISRIRVGKTERKGLRLRRPMGAQKLDALLSTVTEITVEEKLDRVVDPTAVFFECAGAEVQITSSNPPTLLTEEEYFVSAFSSLTPATGTAAGGTSVTLTGRYFLPGARVFFGAIEADTTSVESAVQIIVTTPAHAAGAVDVTLYNADGSVLVLPNGFTFT